MSLLTEVDFALDRYLDACEKSGVNPYLHSKRKLCLELQQHSLRQHDRYTQGQIKKVENSLSKLFKKAHCGLHS